MPRSKSTTPYVPPPDPAISINLTRMWIEAGASIHRKPGQWMRHCRTKAFLTRLGVERSEVLHSCEGNGGGTWATAEVAKEYARYLRHDPRQKTTVYFIQCQVTRLIKIGIAGNVAKRFRKLQTQSPTDLALLKTMTGGRALEAELHAMFAEHRHHGEWFSPHDDLMKYLGLT